MSALTALVSSATTTVELAHDSQSATTPVAVTGWENRSGLLTAEVVFGPYLHQVTADSLWLRIDGEVEVVDLNGTLAIPPGVRVSYDLSIRVTRT